MSNVACPRDDCLAAVRQRPATEMPTLTGEGTVTEFEVRFCDDGHVIGYAERTRMRGDA